jgi:hypothetical protein
MKNDAMKKILIKIQALIDKYPSNSLIHTVLSALKKDIKE